MEKSNTFIEYIKNQGYELMPRKGNAEDFSTMAVMTSYYKKGDIVIGWGLSEVGKPPTLTHPRLYTLTERENKTMWVNNDDATIERILKSVSNEELLTRIENNKLRFELN
jgi:hypothetical protein